MMKRITFVERTRHELFTAQILDESNGETELLHAETLHALKVKVLKVVEAAGHVPGEQLERIDSLFASIAEQVFDQAWREHVDCPGLEDYLDMKGCTTLELCTEDEQGREPLPPGEFEDH